MKSVVQRFNRAAGTYDRYARVQTRLAESLMEMNRRATPPRRILEMGCGTGLLTTRLREAFPEASLWASDAAPLMLDAARLKITSGENHFFVWDAEKPLWPASLPQAPFDLVASNALVQWFPDLRAHFQGCADLMRSGGSLWVSGFLDDNLPELRNSLQAIGLPAPARIGHAAEAVQAAAEDAGLILKTWKGMDERENFDKAGTLLQTLARLGATGGGSEKPLRRGDLGHLVEAYRKSYRKGSGVYATWSTWAAWWIKP